MVKKVKQTVEQSDKQNKINEIQNGVQELVDSKEQWCMSEFREAWNKKNQNKITELVKLNDRMICRFNHFDVSVKVSKMILN